MNTYKYTKCFVHVFKQSFAIVIHTIITQLFFNFVQVWSSDHPNSHSLSEFIQELMHVRSYFLKTKTYTGVTPLLQTQNNKMPVLLYICNMHIYWFSFFTFSIMWGFIALFFIIIWHVKFCVTTSPAVGSKCVLQFSPLILKLFCSNDLKFVYRETDFQKVNVPLRKYSLEVNSVTTNHNLPYINIWNRNTYSSALKCNLTIFYFICHLNQGVSALPRGHQNDFNKQ